MRKRMRRSSGSSGSALAIARCTATAQATASTTLTNSQSAPSLDDPPAMLGDQGLDQRQPERLEPRDRTGLVLADEP